MPSREVQNELAEGMLRRAIHWYIQDGQSANTIIDLVTKIEAETREFEYAEDDLWEPAPE